MAFTNRVAFPNVIVNYFGGVTSWLPIVNPAGIAGSDTTLGEGARALIFLFDQDFLNANKPKSLRIMRQIRLMALSGSVDAILKIHGRLSVIRNIQGDLSKMLFDPFLVDGMLKVDDAVLSNGNTWQIGGVTLPRYNWTKAELIFNEFFFHQGSAVYDVPLPNLQRNENVAVILTPLYNGEDVRPNPNNGDPTTGWSDVGAFIGTPSNFSTTSNYRREISLNVFDTTSCDC
jgi:hypothetical protein